MFDSRHQVSVEPRHGRAFLPVYVVWGVLEEHHRSLSIRADAAAPHQGRRRTHASRRCHVHDPQIDGQGSDSRGHSAEGSQ
jgi:hypothetical protein